MNDKISIDTEYGGFRFRSRIEARWAIFFDAVGVKWGYEIKDFAFNDGVRYLPDYRLYNVLTRPSIVKDIWGEIKLELNNHDLKKIEDLFFSGDAVLVFGNILNGETFDEITNDARSQYYQNQVFFNYYTIDGDNYALTPCAQIGGGLTLVGGDYEYDENEKIDKEKTVKAYCIARQARFEFGETPKRKDVLAWGRTWDMKKKSGLPF